MMCFRHCDRRWPFLWEIRDQPAARWHHDGDGPAQHVADTPDGAWAEFVRHEEITEEIDLAGVSRALWSVHVDVSAAVGPVWGPRLALFDYRSKVGFLGGRRPSVAGLPLAFPGPSPVETTVTSSRSVRRASTSVR